MNQSSDYNSYLRKLSKFQFLAYKIGKVTLVIPSLESLRVSSKVVYLKVFVTWETLEKRMVLSLFWSPLDVDNYFHPNYDSKAINHCEFFLLALLKNSPMKRFQTLRQSFQHLGKPVKLSPLHITSELLWPEVPEYFDAWISIRRDSKFLFSPFTR